MQYRFPARCRSFVLHVCHNKPATSTSSAATGIARIEPLLSKQQYDRYNVSYDN